MKKIILLLVAAGVIGFVVWLVLSGHLFGPSSGNSFEAQGEEIHATLEIPDSAIADPSTISISVVSADAKPSSAIGDLFELQPSGAQFTEPVYLTFTFETVPTKNLTMGYWDPTTQQWSYLPTLREDEKTFKTYVTHFSQVGSYSPGVDGPSNPNVPPQAQAAYNQMIADMWTGEGDFEVSNQQFCEAITPWAEAIIRAYCSEENPATFEAFWQAWVLAGLGCTELDDKFTKAFNDGCEEKITYEYVVDQQNVVPYTTTVSANGWVNATQEAE